MAQSNTDCDLPGKIDFNEGCLKVINKMNTTITMMSITTECYKCDMDKWQTVSSLDHRRLRVFIEYPIKFGFVSSLGASCNKTYTFKQQGWYEWTADLECQPVIETEPPHPVYRPLFGVIGTLFALIILYVLWRIAKHYKYTEKIYYKFRRKKEKDYAESEISEAITTATTATTQTSKGSGTSFPVPLVFSFQVFRGIAVLILLTTLRDIDDNSGQTGRYWFMELTPWNGLMFTDFSYPWFLWGMGAVFYLKYRTQMLLNPPRWLVAWAIVSRSLKYIILGFFVTSFEANNPSTVRIPGELQRYGILHMVFFLLEMFRMKKNVQIDNIRRLRDLLDSWAQILFTLACVAVHLLLTYCLPVPNCPTGYTGPGGLHLYSRYFNCTGGAAKFIDSLVFGDDHLSKNKKLRAIYKTTEPFDPAGVLGTINCGLTVYSGIQAARIFVYYTTVRWRITLLLVWGFLQTTIGLCLCGFMKEEGSIPLNRSLWSLSFALLTSGVAFLVLAGLYVIVDVREWWSGSPCFQAGWNSVLLYAGHSVLRYSLPFSWVPLNRTSYFEFTLMNIITIVFWIVISINICKYKRVL